MTMRIRPELVLVAALVALAACSGDVPETDATSTGGGAGNAAGTAGGGAGGGGAGGGGASGSGGSVTLDQILPKDRIYDWSPGVNVGVPGGIPTRSAICATLDAATFGTGAVDASAALLAAINTCPADQVVFIPAGTYRLDAPVDRITASNVTIRGAGQGQTILQANKAGMRMMWLGNGDRPDTGVVITAGATKGSSIVTVADTAAVTV